MIQFRAGGSEPGLCGIQVFDLEAEVIHHRTSVPPLGSPSKGDEDVRQHIQFESAALTTFAQALDPNLLVSFGICVRKWRWPIATPAELGGGNCGSSGAAMSTVRIGRRIDANCAMIGGAA